MEKDDRATSAYEASFDDPEEDRDPCPTCKGSGTVNPLTAPPGFFCTGTTACPDCDGSGDI